MAAFLSSSSEADQASLIHTVGLRPIQNVMTGLFSDLESFSK